jgi:hypothetical protein
MPDTMTRRSTFGRLLGLLGLGAAAVIPKPVNSEKPIPSKSEPPQMYCNANVGLNDSPVFWIGNRECKCLFIPATYTDDQIVAMGRMIQSGKFTMIEWCDSGDTNPRSVFGFKANFS